VLLAILAVVSVLSYSFLRWSLLQQVDASLASVAQIVRETDERGAGGSEVDRAIRELLGPGFSDRYYQFLDPEGHSRFRSGPPAVTLPLSPEARVNAAQGRRTFETLDDPRGGPIRLLTVPVLREGRRVEIIQVSAPLAQLYDALSGYLASLLTLVPVAVALAAAGGFVVTRRALNPVRDMSRTARQITAAPRTRSIISRIPSTPCSPASRLPSPRRVASPPTRRTSCARPSPRSRVRSKSPSVPSARPKNIVAFSAPASRR
jgi:hypothetical protein